MNSIERSSCGMMSSVHPETCTSTDASYADFVCGDDMDANMHEMKHSSSIHKKMCTIIQRNYFDAIRIIYYSIRKLSTYFLFSIETIPTAFPPPPSQSSSAGSRAGSLFEHRSARHRGLVRSNPHCRSLGGRFCKRFVRHSIAIFVRTNKTRDGPEK